MQKLSNLIHRTLFPCTLYLCRSYFSFWSWISKNRNKKESVATTALSCMKPFFSVTYMYIKNHSSTCTDNNDDGDGVNTHLHTKHTSNVTFNKEFTFTTDPLNSFSSVMDLFVVRCLMENIFEYSFARSLPRLFQRMLEEEIYSMLKYPWKLTSASLQMQNVIGFSI